MRVNGTCYCVTVNGVCYYVTVCFCVTANGVCYYVTVCYCVTANGVCHYVTFIKACFSSVLMWQLLLDLESINVTLYYSNVLGYFRRFMSYLPRPLILH